MFVHILKVVQQVIFTMPEQHMCLRSGAYYQFFVAIIANFIAITDGITMGWTSPMIPYFLSENSHIKMSQVEAEWMETYLLIGAICGLPITLYVVDKFGRKKSILFSCCFLTLCWIVIAIADKIIYIYLARFAKGIGLNMAFVAMPMYIGEIAQKSIRGFLSSMTFVLMLTGVVLIYSLGPFVPYYFISVLAGALLVTEFIVFIFMPESPYFLIQKNKYEMAKASLQKFRDNSNVEDELNELLSAHRRNLQQDKISLRNVCSQRNYRKAMLIMAVLNFAQLFSSFEVILMNLHHILEEARSIYISSHLVAIIFSVIMLCATIVASLLMDSFGRKLLLIVSGILTGLCLISLAIYFHLQYLEYDLEQIKFLPVICVMSYAACFKLGLGSVPIVVTAEIFAPKIKTFGMTAADGMYVLASIIALQLFFALRDQFGMFVPFYVFSACSFITVIYVIFCIPETKGKTLDEIQEILKR